MPDVKALSRGAWKSFTNFTEEPKFDHDQSGTRRALGAVFYVACSLLALYVSYEAVTYNSVTTDVLLGDGAGPYPAPDMIICPRANFAVYPRSVDKPANSSSLEVRRSFRKRYLLYARKAAWMQRAHAHEHYRYTVWYNLPLIELLHMPVEHVNAVTEMARNRTVDDVDDLVIVYMKRLHELVSRTYQHDLEILSEHPQSASAFHDWKTPIHPRLQKLIVNSSNATANLTLLWWSIVEPRYLLSYGEDDNVGSRHANRRFACITVSECEYFAVWLDDHYCVMWDRQRFHGRNLRYYPLTIAEEYQAWMGNTKMENVTLDRFEQPVAHEDGWQMSERFSENFPMERFRHRPVTIRLETGMVQPVCQSLLTAEQNSDAIRQKYCNNTEMLYEYVVYERKPRIANPVYESSGHDRTLIVRRKSLTALKVIGVCGGIFGTFTGLSLSQLLVVGLKVGRVNRKLAAIVQVIVELCFIVLVVFWIQQDIRQLMAERYRSELVVTPAADAPIPSLGLRGGGHYSRLMLNQTRLAEHDVDPILLEYIMMAATAKHNYGQLFKNTHWAQSTKQFWSHPYDIKFVVSAFRPTAYELAKIHERYVRLTERIGLDPAEPAHHVARYFLLNKCAIIKSCTIRGQEDAACCAQWEWYQFHTDGLYYMLSWINRNQTAFGNDAVDVDIDTTQYVRHSDVTANYLGPEANDTLKEQLRWPQLGRLYILIRHESKLFELNIGGSDSTKLSVRADGVLTPGRQLVLDLGLTTQHHMSGDERPNVSCAVRPACKADRYLVRKLLVASACGCRLCDPDVSENNVEAAVKQLAGLECCLPQSLIACLTREEFYPSTCPGAPGRHSITLTHHPEWDDSSSTTANQSTQNVFTAPYNDQWGCYMLKAYGEGSEHDYVRAEWMQPCKQPWCASANYAIVTETALNLPDPKQTFRLTLRMKGDLNIGEREYDSFSLLKVASVFMGVAALFFGISIVHLIVLIVQLIIALCKRRTLEIKKARADLFGHWHRSLGFWLPDENANMVADAPQAAGQKREEVNDDDATDAAGWLHVFAVVMQTALTVLTVIIIGWLIHGSYDNHVIDGKVTHYSVEYTDEIPLPEVLLCADRRQSASATFADLKRLTCQEKLQPIPCERLFDIYLVIQNRSCVATHRRSNDVLDPKVPWLQMENFEDVSFTHYWIGDIRTLCEQNTTFMSLHVNATRTLDARFAAFNTDVDENCVDEPPPVRLGICEMDDDDERTGSDQLCALAGSTAANKSQPAVRLSTTAHLQPLCVTTAYNVHLYNQYDVTTTPPSQHMVLRLLANDRIVYSVRRHAAHNWALKFMVFAGYIDELVGISALNLLFVCVWFALGGRCARGQAEPNNAITMQVKPPTTMNRSSHGSPSKPQPQQQPGLLQVKKADKRAPSPSCVSGIHSYVSANGININHTHH